MRKRSKLEPQWKKRKFSGSGCEISWNKPLNKWFIKYLLGRTCQNTPDDACPRHPPRWATWWSWSWCRHRCQRWRTASSSSQTSSWRRRTSPSQWDGKPPRQTRLWERGKSKQRWGRERRREEGMIKLYEVLCFKKDGHISLGWRGFILYYNEELCRGKRENLLI